MALDAHRVGVAGGVGIAMAKVRARRMCYVASNTSGLAGACEPAIPVCHAGVRSPETFGSRKVRERLLHRGEQAVHIRHDVPRA
jgi:hypothetical protein